MAHRLVIAALLAACGGNPGAPPAAAPESAGGYATAAPVRDLRQVDWMNRAYAIDDGGDGVDLIAGEYWVDGGAMEWDRGGGDRGWFVVREPSFGDVDGDGDDEAIVVVIANGGGSGAFSAGLVYDARAGGEPVITARVPGGDRGAGGLVSIEVVEPRTLRVVRNWLAAGEGANNSSLIRVERWRWEGAALVEDESARQVEPNPR
jgi:hypothetical protein